MPSKVAPYPSSDDPFLDFDVTITMTANEWLMVSAALAYLRDRPIGGLPGRVLEAVELHIDRESQRQGVEHYRPVKKET